jgi:hypothetical protein
MASSLSFDAACDTNADELPVEHVSDDADEDFIVIVNAMQPLLLLGVLHQMP